MAILLFSFLLLVIVPTLQKFSPVDFAYSKNLAPRIYEKLLF